MSSRKSENEIMDAESPAASPIFLNSVSADVSISDFASNSTAPTSPRGGWAASLVLGFGLLAVYMANGRMIGGGDTVPAMMGQVALARGNGPFLDRFDHVLREPDGRLPGYAADKRGHVVSRYPIGPALLAAPLAWPQVVWRDAVMPDWERSPDVARRECRKIAKLNAAIIAALAMVVLFHALKRMGSRSGFAAAAVIATALGSCHWSMASQGLWQHGPAALCLATAMLLLSDDRPRRARANAIGAGIATALMTACRPVDATFALAIGIWVWRWRPAIRVGFFAPTAVIALALASYHLYFFGALSGGYRDIEKMHPWAHGLKGTWTGSWIGGGMGTLFSPSHGLIYYSPWVIVAGLVAIPQVWRRLPQGSLARWLCLGLVLNFAPLAKYSCWWGGHCYGPRFWIDAGPVLALAAAYALEWAADTRRRAIGIAFGVATAAAIGVQAVGAFAYPSSWHSSPTNADRDHARLWDWSDNEFTRGIIEGPKPRD